MASFSRVGLEPFAADSSTGSRHPTMPSPAGPSWSLGRPPVWDARPTEQLAGLGARVVLVGRSEARLAAVRDDLVWPARRRPVPDRRGGHGVARLRAGGRGVGSSRPNPGSTSSSTTQARSSRSEPRGPTGSKSTFATLVVGPFVLVSGLLPLLRRTRRRTRHRRDLGRHVRPAARPRRPEFASGRYDGTRAYARSKRAQVALVREWARRLGAVGNPRQCDASRLGRHAGTRRGAAGLPRRHASAAAHPGRGRRHARLAGSPSREPTGRRGRLFLDRRSRPFDRVPATRLSRRRSATPLGRRRRAQRGARSRLPTCIRQPLTGNRIDDDRDHAERTNRDDPADRGGLRLRRRLRQFAGVGPGRRDRRADRRRSRRRRGSRYRLGVHLGGRVAPMEYRIADVRAAEPGRPRRLRLRCLRRRRDPVRRDAGTGTRIDYTADIRLGGLLRLAQPFLGGAFRKVAREAADGMRRTLADRARAAGTTAAADR